MSEPLLPCVGIDVSKQTLDIALRHTGKLRTRKVTNTAEGLAQFSDWLKQQGVNQAHICLEATGTYSDASALFARLKASSRKPMRRMRRCCCAIANRNGLLAGRRLLSRCSSCKDW